MKKELVHFVEWKKIPEETVESVLADLQSWGVKNIVAHNVIKKRINISVLFIISH